MLRKRHRMEILNQVRGFIEEQDGEGLEQDGDDGDDSGSDKHIPANN